MEHPVRCQLFHTNETSPFASCCVAPRIGLAHFRGLVERFAPKFRAGGIRYLDDEGDQITIETDIELEEALKLGQKLGVLKVIVDGVKVETPAPAPTPIPAPAPAVQVPVKEEPQQVPPATAAPKVTHRAICDHCRKYIAGIRYKCANCPDYDLCETCEELFGKQEGIHPQDHVFLKIRKPICPYHRLAIPNLYEPAGRRPCVGNRRCPFSRPSVTVNAVPAPVAPAIPNNHEARISALEATVAHLAQELSTVTEEKKRIEERKKAQEQKRKELKEQLQKKTEERAAQKAERKLKKAQQMEANRVAAQARQAARQAKQVAVAQTRAIKVEVVPTPAPVQEPAKIEEVVEEVKVEVSEPVQIVHVEDIPQQEEEEEEEETQEQQEAAEEEKRDDDFVVISEEAPTEQDERRSYFRESLEILAGMGFSDIDRNLHLLAHFAGDIHAVITALLEVA